MRTPALIQLECEVLKLRNRDSQRISHSLQTCVALSLVRFVDLSEEITPEWILDFVHLSASIPYDLGNDMRVSDAIEKVVDVPEVPILSDLFDNGLRQRQWVIALIALIPIKNNFSIFLN